MKKFLVLVALAAMLLLLPHSGLSEKSGLTSSEDSSQNQPADAKTAQRIRAVKAALNDGDPAHLHQRLLALIENLDGDALESVDTALAAQDLPPAGVLLGQARGTLMLSGREAPRMSAREAVLVLPAWREQVQLVLNQLLESDVMNVYEPSPDSLEQYERLLWKAHVLENELHNSVARANQAVVLLGQIPRRQLARLSNDQQKAVGEDYQQLVEQLADAKQHLADREAELRIERLALARAVLERETLDQEKLLAAFAWWTDTQLLKQFFKEAEQQQRDSFHRELLNEPGLTDHLWTLSDESKQLAGDLTRKSMLLHQGLHWWLRGRYGTGTDFQGMAKSEAALRSPEAQFALYMPQEPPVPNQVTLASAERPVPLYDRRHHYWWNWETRRVKRYGDMGGGVRHDDDFTGTLYELQLQRFY